MRFKKHCILYCLSMLLGFLVSAQSKTLSESKRLANGKKVYSMYCLACHQADGNGVPRLNPPLAGTDYVTGSKTRLIDIVLYGLTEPLEINEEVYNNPMASHAFLSDQQVADVLSYIRNSFGNKAGMIAATEVKKQRNRQPKK